MKRKSFMGLGPSYFTLLGSRYRLEAEKVKIPKGPYMLHSLGLRVQDVGFRVGMKYTYVPVPPRLSCAPRTSLGTKYTTYPHGPRRL